MLCVIMIDEFVSDGRLTVESPSTEIIDNSTLPEQQHQLGTHRFVHQHLDTIFHLDFWGKLAVACSGVAFVCLTLFIVVCFVGPGCCMYNIISKVLNAISALLYL